MSNADQTSTLDHDIFGLSFAELGQLPITTPSRLEETPLTTPGTTYIVTNEEIKERGYFHLMQLLEDLPGIQNQEGAGSDSFNISTIRGIHFNNKLMILQDGVRIDSPTGDPIPIFENIPLHLAKHVEVVIGPASALYGPDAFNGVVNIITENPQEVEELSVAGYGGGFGERRIYVKGGKQFSNSIGLLVGGHYHEADNANLPARFPDLAPFGDLRQLDGNLFLSEADRAPYRGEITTYSLFGKVTLLDSITLGINHWTMVYPTGFAAFPNLSNFTDKANNDKSVSTVYGHYQETFGKQFTAQATIRYSRYEIDPDSRFVNVFTNFDDGFVYAFGDGLRIDVQGDYAITPKSTITGGIVYEDLSSIQATASASDSYDREKDFDDQGLFIPNTNNTIPNTIFSVDYHTLGGFMQWRQEWGEQLISTIGVRYDTSSNYDHSWNPRVGLVYTFAPQTILKAHYGRAFLQPSPALSRQAFGSFTGAQDGSGRYITEFYHLPNLNLQPEIIDSWELSFLHQFSPWSQLTVSPYINHVQNLILEVPHNQTESEALPGAVIRSGNWNDNAGDATAYGFDIDWQHTVPFEMGYFSWYLRYSFVDGRVKQNGIDQSSSLPFTSKSMVKAGLTLKVPHWVTFSPRLRWVDKITRSVPADDSRPQKLEQAPPSLVFDLHTQISYFEPVTLLFTVTNLLDAKNAIAGSASASISPRPLQPRRFLFGLKIDLDLPDLWP